METYSYYGYDENETDIWNDVGLFQYGGEFTALIRYNKKEFECHVSEIQW